MDLGLKSEVEKQKHKHECELPSSTVKTRERGSQGRRRAPRATPTGTRRRGPEEHRGAQSQGEGVCRSRLWDHVASGCCRGRSHRVALRPQLSLWMRFTRPSASRPHPAARCSGSHLRRCSEELRGGGERSSLPRPCSGPRARPAPGNSPRRVPTAGAPGTLCKAHSPLLRSQPLPSRVPLMAREPARSLTHLAACCGVHDDSTFISTRLQGRRTVSHAKGKCCCERWGRRKEAEEGSQPRV